MPKYITANRSKEITSVDIGNYLLEIREEWFAAILVFLWAYGVRIGEALRLRRVDFYQADGYLWVNCPPLKMRKEMRRVLPISLKTPHIAELVKYLDELDAPYLVWPMSRMTIYRRFKAIDEELSSHVFRHNRATQLALTRPHPYELQSWLGHSDIRMASKYIHASGIFAEDLGKKVIPR